MEQKKRKFWAFWNVSFWENRRIFNEICDVLSDMPDCEVEKNNIKKETKQKCDDLKGECSVLLKHKKEQSTWEKGENEWLAILKSPNAQKNSSNPEFVTAYKESIAVLDARLNTKKREILNQHPDLKTFEDWIRQAPLEAKKQYAEEMMRNTVFFSNSEGKIDEKKIAHALAKISSHEKFDQNLDGSLPFMKIYAAFFCDDPRVSPDEKNLKDYGKKKAFYSPLYEEEKENGKNVIMATPENFAGVLENVKPNTIVKMRGGKTAYEGPFLCQAEGVTIQPQDEKPVIIQGSGKGNVLSLTGKNSSLEGQNTIIFQTPHADVALQLRGENCSVKNCSFSGIQTGIQSIERNAVIENCHFNECSKDGIIFCGDGTNVHNNTFKNYIGQGNAHNDWIQMFKGEESMENGRKQYFKDRFSGNYRLSNVKIDGNTLDGNGNSKLQGITIFQAFLDNSFITNNKIDVGSVHGISIQGNGNRIEGNTLHNPNSFINISGEENAVDANYYQQKPTKENTNPSISLVAAKSYNKDWCPVSNEMRENAKKILPSEAQQTRYDLP